jgi:two-component system, chemotaxis family, chemotaxis protein CheY
MADRKRCKVLIIDDDNMSRTILRTIILGDDYEIVGEATNGKKGVELALELKPDVVCLDNVMPEMSGLDALLEIRAKLPQTLILMVTGSADRETVQAALQGGADGYVVKPFNSGRVLAALEQALAKGRSQNAAT